MIAKITRGGSAAGLAAYLHGPGAGTEHTTEVDGRQVPGGAVVASNVPGVQVGDLDGRRWGRWLDRAAASRPEIKGPVWHCSLNLAPGDRALTRQEWADAATGFVQRMGIPSGHPWAAVQHDDRGIHIAVSRVNDTGRVWHARHDRRTAQKARQALEREYRLTEAPIRKTGYGAVLPEPPAVGVHTVAGDTWRVRSRDGRAVTASLIGRGYTAYEAAYVWLAQAHAGAAAGAGLHAGPRRGRRPRGHPRLARSGRAEARRPRPRPTRRPRARRAPRSRRRRWPVSSRWSTSSQGLAASGP